MNAHRFTSLLVLFALSCCLGLPSAVSRNLTDEWVENAAGRLIENRVVDGLSIGYIEGKHWGIVHLGSSTRVGKNADNLTLYELGSVSKLFTSLLLADAVVRGEIKLAAPTDVPNSAGIRLPARDGRQATWLDLSTHRSGLPRLPDNLSLTEPTNPYREYDAKMAAAFLNQYELPRRPGETQEYSNLGASVLGCFVAENAGKSYDELLQERIAEPLQMTDCTVSLRGNQKERLALPHDKFGSSTPPWTFADLPGAGGIRATMRDMMRFAKAQLTPPGGTLGDAIELAWKQHTAADVSGPAMGLGWMIAGDGQTRWHNGQTGGSSATIFVNRELKCAIVVLCNTAVANEIDKLAMQLMLKAAGQQTIPELGDPSDQGSDNLAIAEELRGRLVGRYQLTPNFIFDVQDRNGHLMVGITNQPTQEVFPDSPTRWSYRGVDATLEFKLPSSGPARSLVLHQNGIEQKAFRIETEPNEAPDPDVDKLLIDAKLRRRLVGRYELNPDFIFTVRDRNGRMMVGITNQPTQEVFPDSPTHWSYRGVDATLEFKLPKTGRARSLVLHQNGVEQAARRIE